MDLEEPQVSSDAESHVSDVVSNGADRSPVVSPAVDHGLTVDAEVDNSSLIEPKEKADAAEQHSDEEWSEHSGTTQGCTPSFLEFDAMSSSSEDWEKNAFWLETNQSTPRPISDEGDPSTDHSVVSTDSSVVSTSSEDSTLSDIDFAHYPVLEYSIDSVVLSQVVKDLSNQVEHLSRRISSRSSRLADMAFPPPNVQSIPTSIPVSAPVRSTTSRGPPPASINPKRRFSFCYGDSVELPPRKK